MKALEADLVEAGHKYQGGKYYTAGYDDPMKMDDRWIVGSKSSDYLSFPYLFLIYFQNFH